MDRFLEKWQKARKSREGMEELLDYLKPLIKKAAHRYRNPYLTEEDLMQEGMIAVIESVYRFDPDRGVYFLKYVREMVYGRIYSLLRAEKARRGKEVPLEEYRIEVQHFAEELPTINFPPGVLTPRQESLIALRYERGISLSEVAKILKITPAGAYDLEKRALKKLKKYYLSLKTQ
ncbi:RNA polymerase sigma-70 factor [Carboxydothermus islandicus]|uniref:RNA polymerase sigma-70 factor n=1 Tax=Carboxydothermus islandicus TaxID=661089 RepID=A0A1L8D2A0_9THEO|nr:sigma-70 family RNA polymerase sigma factor [Carboxydothermus islandicus]GAV25279.1 RNA polymerase sigma-70 factor [Carboxydothermus islandicus]